MEKIEFKSESKRVLDLMINSIYTNKEIFLRELISNASDAIDKLYYKSLTDENISFDKDKFFIKIDIDEDNRLLKITDTGIGMTKEELEENLGVIAKSGSLNFKENLNDKKDENIDIIGQFGVGFYSAFMVADKVEVTTRSINSEKAFKWESEGSDGYIITEANKEEVGTEIVLHIKENTEDVEYDEYLDEYRIKNIIKKHSDYIRYPIKMEVTKYDYDEEEEMKTYKEEETVNSMVPIWRKNKNELTDEDYMNFYKERHFGFDEPLRHIHFSVDGHMSYKALLYIPSEPIFNYYTTEYEKGLELYSSGVLIKEKAEELLPDYFSFVKGVVDSEDLSLNISREMLQNDRQLALMAKRI
ncbi:MAG TPA: molecular chaperone HtpG, partial [Tissierellaceae bacterium]